MSGNHDYVTAVLTIYAEADLHDGLLWRLVDGEIRFTAICSDFFYWGTADGETIEHDDVEALQLAFNALLACDSVEWLSELFAARKRGMRPMRLALGNHPGQLDGTYTTHKGMGPGPLQELFLSCGPERDQKTEG